MNFLEFIQIVKDENACYDLYEQWKWGDKVVSPFDPTSKVYKCKNHKYKCKNTNRYFTVKTIADIISYSLIGYFFIILYLKIGWKINWDQTKKGA